MSDPTSYELDYANGDNNPIDANACLVFRSGVYLELVFADVTNQLLDDGQIKAKGTLLKRFKIPESVARDIADELNSRLAPIEQHAGEPPPTSDNAAFANLAVDR